MGLLWDLFSDEEAFIRRMRSEMRNAEIIIELERRIDVSPQLPSGDEIHRLMKDFFGTNIESDLHVLRQKMEELKQGIQAENTGMRVQLENMGDRMNGLEACLKTAASPSEQPGVSGVLIAEQRMEVEQLHRLLVTQSQTIARLQADVAAQRQENDALKQQTARNVQQIDALARQCADQARAIDEIRRQASLVRPAVSPVPTSPKPPAPDLMPNPIESVQSVPAPQPEPPVKAVVRSKAEKQWISAFSLPNPTTDEAFFCGDAAVVREKLTHSIQWIDALMTDVRQLPLKEDAGNSFVKNLRQTKESLEKFCQKTNFAEYDEDELSEKVTEKYFKIIGDNILDNIMPGIYRGGQDAAGYGALLQKLNIYLSRHGIYTLDISPSTANTGSLGDHIEPPVLKQTMSASDDGKIAEVELLPYFINYADDDGNITWLRKRGRVICLKYGEMK